ncbi:beta-ketoacyl reductase, partial [Streptomyces sp. NPDC050804]|uniref:beta-ketoacyl reductase n=1 Tax=Streptomyces sp. NPDC050804 TaxID=3154745 RepID=UPI003413DB38
THLPFAFTGIRLHATGAHTARIHITPTTPETVSVTVFDPTGQPVADIESLSLRPVDPGQFAVETESGLRDSLFTVNWVPVTAEDTTPVPAYADITDALTDLADGVPVAVRFTAAPGPDVPESAHELGHRALTAVQQWLAEERTAGAPLVVVTSSAVATGSPGEPVDPAGAVVWGLLRSAQTENPGRFVLADLDEAAMADPVRHAAAVAAAAASGEPQLAVREGRLLAPRLNRVASTAPAEAGWDPDGTVLVTGATGTLGTLLARHLVRAHGVRRLLLTSRRGPDAPGSTELAAELAELGAEAVFAACDVADPDAVAALVAAIPSAHPLRAVVHAAGVVDDGVIGTLTPERLDRVLRPKADAAWHLHRATEGLDLKAFVLFSS